MAQLNQPVVLQYSSGKNVWFMAFRQSDFYVLEVATKTWVPFVLGNLADYVMTYTEIASTGIYVGYYPEDFLLDVLPLEASYQQAGVAPALPDDLPGITIGQSQGASVAAVAYSVAAASNLQKNAAAMEQATVQAGVPTTNTCPTDLTAAVDDFYNGRVVIFTSGAGARQAAIITAFDAGTGLLTFTPVVQAPSPGDTLLVA